MSQSKSTAMVEAFAKAGHRDPREQLAELAAAALAQHPRTLDLARALLLKSVSGDPLLLWVMFERWHNLGADLLLQAAAARSRAKSEASRESQATVRSPPQSGAMCHADTNAVAPQRPGSTEAAGPTHAQREDARTAVARVISKLDTFKINGRPIGDCTAQEALGWRAARVRDNRFVYLMTANLPPDMPIRDFITAQEAEALYRRAQEETANE